MNGDLREKAEPTRTETWASDTKFSLCCGLLLLFLPLTPFLQIMDQEDKIIVRPTLDTIPEDVVLAIVKFVNKWAEVRDIEKDSGRK